MVLTDRTSRERTAPGFLPRGLRTPANGPVMLLLLMLPVTWWVSAWPELTHPQVWQLLAGIAGFYAVILWAGSPLRQQRLAWGLRLLGLALALVASFGVHWATYKLPFIPASLYTHLPTLLADPINPNVMGGALALLLPLAAAPLVFSWRRLRPLARALALLATVCMAVMLLLAQSRGALLGTAAALLALCALRWRRGWLIIPAALALAGLGAWYVGFDRAVAMVAATGSFGGLAGRLEIWSRAWYLLNDFPFTGIGMGAFRPAANALYPFFSFAPATAPPHAHNIYLQIAVDLGLPGLVAWLALLLLTTRSAWRAYRQGRELLDDRLTGLAAGLLAGQAALITHGCLDAATWGTRPAMIVWLLWGLCMVLWHVSELN